MYEVAIVGGGIGGAAAALRAGQYHLKTAWITGDKQTARRSRSRWVQNVDNMIGVHADIVLNKLRKQWHSQPELLAALDGFPHVSLHIGTNDIIEDVHDRLADYADFVDIIPAAAIGAAVLDDGTFEVSAGNTIHARHVVLATGMMDRQPLVRKHRKGEILERPNWVYPFANRESVLYCIRCEGHLTRQTQAAIIGAGESAAQSALMLHERYGSTSVVLTNGETPSWEPDTQRLLDHFGIPVRTEHITDLSDAEGKTRGTLRTIALEGGDTVEVSFAMVCLGLYRIYNDLARQLGAELLNPDAPPELRHVRIDNKGETTVRGVFAVGDMALRADERVMKQIYTAQEYAVRAVDTIDRRRRKRGREEILAELRTDS